MKVKTNFHILLPLWIITAILVAGPGLAVAEVDASEQPASADSEIAGEVVETETGIYYTVKEGDTLWDLSRKFSDSPYLWPNLWSKNAQISNPHMIFPGEKIKLYRRKDTEQYNEPTEAQVIAATAQHPEPEPEPQMQEPMQEPIQEAMEEPDLGDFSLSEIDQVGFIRRELAEAYGKIFKVRQPKKMISTGDIIYISESGDHRLITGNRYTVYRAVTKVWDSKTNAYIGIQHYLLGVVEITLAETEYAIAKVVSSNSNIKIGDLVMPYKHRSQRISKTKSPDGILGEIIMAENHGKIIGDYSIAFINRGENDGILPGQQYNIYYQEEERISADSSKKILLQPVDYGAFMVVLTEENTSTVYITNASQNIHPGAKFRSPAN